MSDRGGIMPEIIEEGPNESEAAKLKREYEEAMKTGRVDEAKSILRRRDLLLLRERSGNGYQKVYVAGFVTDSGTGGFEWSAERDPIEIMRKQWVAEGDAEITQVREIEVPNEHCVTNDEITQWLDSNSALWEPEQGERPSRLEQVMARTDELEGNEIMQNVVVCILDREEDDVIDVDRIVYFLEEEGVDDLYMNFIAPAIDQCEKAIREQAPREGE